MIFIVLIKCEDMERSRINHQIWIFPIGIVVSSLFLFVTNLYSFLLFHTVVELFTVVISFGIFAVAWSSRRYINNTFLLLVGVSYLFIGSIDLMHILTYEGINIITNYGTNLSAQLWIVARYLEATSFVAAFLLLKNNINEKPAILNSRWIFFVYTVIISAVASLIFVFDVFPVAYVAGDGVTQFFVYSEYIISTIFLGALILLFKKRKKLDQEMVNILSLSIILKIISELFFTGYVNAQDFSNMLGHIFQFISSLLLYKAVIEGGLMKPYKFLFLDLKRSEERYRSLVEFSPDAIVVHSHGKIVYANGSAKKLFGIEENKSIVGANLIEFFGPEYRDHIRLRIKNIFSGKWQQAPTMEMAILHANGQTIPVEVKGMKISYGGKEVIESIIRDVSKQKAAEEKIRSLAKFPEEDPNPVIRVLAGGQVQYANQPARKMLSHLGWNTGDPLPKTLLTTFEQVLKKNVKQEVEFTCIHGQTFSILFAPSLTDECVNLYGRDISKRKMAEEELARTQDKLRRKIEEQLMESYKHLGLVNRKISLLLELENHSQSKENKQEIVKYILSSLLNLSYAKAGLLYLAVGKNHFNLISSVGLEKKTTASLQVVSESNAKFINQLTATGKRVNGACDLVDTGCFKINFAFSYFVALPILSESICKGFLFLGFTDRKSMDTQELEFLDIFAKHVSSALTNSAILK